jgi:putative FmdB family regulatory protein
MPIYEYRCKACGQVTEALIRSAREAEGVRCGHCGDGELERVHLSAIAPVPTDASREDLPCCGAEPGCSDPKRCCQR